jgi:PAS domain-containing protein
MEEKSIMTRSDKLKAKKKTSNTNKDLLTPADQQMIPSEKVFDAIPLAIISVDWNGQVQYMNRLAKSMLGEADKQLKLEEWPSKFGFYLDDGIMPYPAAKLPLARVLQGETVGEAEEIILRKDGDEKGIWISMSAELLRDENYNIDGAIALIAILTIANKSNYPGKNIKRTEALYSFSHAI